MAAPDFLFTTASDIEKKLPLEARRASRRAQRIFDSNPIHMRIDSRPLGKITADLDEFDKSLEASNARVLAFGATTGVIVAAQQAFRSMIRTTIDVEKALKDINVVFGLTQKNFQAFSKNLFKIAAQTGQTFQIVAEAAGEFARQGLNAAKTAEATHAALVLVRLAGIDAESAVSALTAAVNTFNHEGLTHIEIVNRMANVDAAFAVSSSDLAEGFKRVGASAKDANVSFNQLGALITALQQTTARGGPVIGNGLKTIFTRLQRSSTLELLERMNVAVRDTSGEMLPAIQILENLAKSYNTLTQEQRSQVAQATAGVFQINTLKAVINDLGGEVSIYRQALQVANNTTDEAERRNRSLNATLSALINKTGAELKEFVSDLGNVSLAPAIRELIERFRGFIQLLSEDSDKSSLGTRIGQGILKGISDVLTGPGFILVIGLIAKLTKDVAAASTGAVSSILSLNSRASKQAQLQQAIKDAVFGTSKATQAWALNAQTVEERHKRILSILRQQEASAARTAGLFGATAGNLIGTRAVSISGSAASRNIRFNAAGGLLPAIAKEGAAIGRGVGGVSASSNVAILRNFPFGGGKKGTIVANTGEHVVSNFAGGGGAAIFNPDMVRAIGGKQNLKTLGRVSKVENFAGGGFPAAARANRFRATLGGRSGSASAQQADLFDAFFMQITREAARRRGAFLTEGRILARAESIGLSSSSPAVRDLAHTVGQQNRQRRGQAALLGAIATPILTNSITSGINTQGVGGRLASGIGSSVGSGVATGAIIGGPAGVVAGGGLAIHGVIKTLTTATRKSLADLSKELEEFANKTNEAANAVNQVILKEGALQQLRTSGASIDKILLAEKSREAALRDIGIQSVNLETKIRGILDSGNPNAGALIQQEVFGFQQNRRAQTASRELDVLFRKTQDQFGGRFLGLQFNNPVLRRFNLDDKNNPIGGLASGVLSTFDSRNVSSEQLLNAISGPNFDTRDFISKFSSNFEIADETVQRLNQSLGENIDMFNDMFKEGVRELAVRKRNSQQRERTLQVLFSINQANNDNLRTISLRDQLNRSNRSNEFNALSILAQGDIQLARNSLTETGVSNLQRRFDISRATEQRNIAFGELRSKTLEGLNLSSTSPEGQRRIAEAIRLLESGSVRGFDALREAVGSISPGGGGGLADSITIDALKILKTFEGQVKSANARNASRLNAINQSQNLNFFSDFGPQTPGIFARNILSSAGRLNGAKKRDFIGRINENISSANALEASFLSERGFNPSIKFSEVDRDRLANSLTGRARGQAALALLGSISGFEQLASQVPTFGNQTNLKSQLSQDLAGIKKGVEIFGATGDRSFLPTSKQLGRIRRSFPRTKKGETARLGFDKLTSDIFSLTRDLTGVGATQAARAVPLDREKTAVDSLEELANSLSSSDTPLVESLKRLEKEVNKLGATLEREQTISSNITKSAKLTETVRLAGLEVGRLEGEQTQRINDRDTLAGLKRQFVSQFNIDPEIRKFAGDAFDRAVATSSGPNTFRANLGIEMNKFNTSANASPQELFYGLAPYSPKGSIVQEGLINFINSLGGPESRTGGFLRRFYSDNGIGRDLNDIQSDLQGARSRQEQALRQRELFDAQRIIPEFRPSFSVSRSGARTLEDQLISGKSVSDPDLSSAIQDNNTKIENLFSTLIEKLENNPLAKGISQKLDIDAKIETAKSEDSAGDKIFTQGEIDQIISFIEGQLRLHLEENNNAEEPPKTPPRA